MNSALLANVGTAALALACAIASLGAASDFVAFLRGPRRGPWHRLGLAFGGLQAIAFGTAFLALAVAFLTGAVGIEYVWQNTSLAYPWYYKLAGVWASQKGSVLLWGFDLSLLAGILAAIEAWPRRAQGPTPASEAPLFHLARTLHLALVAAFAGYLLADTVFAPTAASALAGNPDGQGLVEVLQTPFMVIHPPIQFLAYALTAVPALFAFAGTFTAAPPKDWLPKAMAWGRPAWLFATAGLALGGLWAYYVLSFAGYWAWDPVEVANLLPYLALTAFLHAGKYLGRHGDFPKAAPAFAMGALALVFFSTFETRSGLWLSVHAFTDPTNRFEQDAALRALNILDASLTTRFFASLLATTLLLGAAAFARSLLARPQAPFIRTVGRGYLAALAVLAAWSIVDVRGLLGALFQLGAALPAGTGAGAAGVALIALGGPLVFGFLADSRDDRFPVFSARGGYHLGVAILALTIGVLLVLDLSVVNNPDRAPFDSRAPFLAAAIVAVLTWVMAYRPYGRAGAALLTAAGLGGASAAAYLASAGWLPYAPVVAAAVPACAAAGWATVARLVVMNRDGGTRTRFLASAVLLLLGGLLGILFGADPPQTVEVGSLVFATGLAPGLFFIAAGTVALLSGVGVLRRLGRYAGLLGALACVLAVGYGMGAVLGLVGGILSWRNLEAEPILGLRRPGPAVLATVGAIVALATVGFAASGGLADGSTWWVVVVGIVAFVTAGIAGRAGWRLRPAAAPRVARGLRQTGLWVLHFALILFFVGFAASTYGASHAGWPESAPAATGSALSIGNGTTLLLGESAGTPGAGSRVWYSTLDVPVTVVQNRAVTDRFELELDHRGDPFNHYSPVLQIRRGWTADLYVSVSAMEVNGTWIRAFGDECVAPRTSGAGLGTAGAPQGACAYSDRVQAVAIDVTTLPLVGFVWAGAVLFVLSMIAILASGLATRAVVAGADAQGDSDTTRPVVEPPPKVRPSGADRILQKGRR